MGFLRRPARFSLVGHHLRSRMLDDVPMSRLHAYSAVGDRPGRGLPPSRLPRLNALRLGANAGIGAGAFPPNEIQKANHSRTQRRRSTPVAAVTLATWAAQRHRGSRQGTIAAPTTHDCFARPRFNGPPIATCAHAHLSYDFLCLSPAALPACACADVVPSPVCAPPRFPVADVCSPAHGAQAQARRRAHRERARKRFQ